MKKRNALYFPLAVFAALFSLAAASTSAVAAPAASRLPALQAGATTNISTMVDGQLTTYLRPARTAAELQAQIDAQLASVPGGKQINDNEISYNDGKFIMAFARPGQKAGVDPRSSNGSFECDLGWYCFYDGVNFTYPQGRLSDCGWQDLATWKWNDRIESFGQQRDPLHPNYKVKYYNHAAGHTDHAADEFDLESNLTYTTLADATPYRNVVDHADKRCLKSN